MRPARTRSHRWLWRWYARFYDALEGVAGYREMLDAVATAAGPLDGLRVIEVGCGTGNVLGRLLRERPAHLTGIDLSVEMLLPARLKLRHELAAGSVALVEADAVAGLSAVADSGVDLLVVVNLLYALPERTQFWAQAARVLAPGGRVVVCNPDTAGFAPAIRQQWRERGIRGFADPRLAVVILLNLAIDAIARTGRYAFLPWDALLAEAAEAGLDRGHLVARCYGGPSEGMNVVGTIAAGR